MVIKDDPYDISKVSREEFNQFLKLYGPVDSCFMRMTSTFITDKAEPAEWFRWEKDWSDDKEKCKKEVEKLVKKKNSIQFFVRLSQNRQNFVVHVSNGAMIKLYLKDGKYSDQGGDKTFDSVRDLLLHYQPTKLLEDEKKAWKEKTDPANSRPSDTYSMYKIFSKDWDDKFDQFYNLVLGGAHTCAACGNKIMVRRDVSFGNQHFHTECAKCAEAECKAQCEPGQEGSFVISFVTDANHARISSMSITELKKELDARRIDSTGLQGALVDRLMAAIPHTKLFCSDHLIKAKKLVKQRKTSLEEDTQEDTQEESLRDIRVKDAVTYFRSRSDFLDANITKQDVEDMVFVLLVAVRVFFEEDARHVSQEDLREYQQQAIRSLTLSRDSTARKHTHSFLDQLIMATFPLIQSFPFWKTSDGCDETTRASIASSKSKPHQKPLMELRAGSLSQEDPQLNGKTSKKKLDNSTNVAKDKNLDKLVDTMQDLLVALKYCLESVSSKATSSKAPHYRPENSEEKKKESKPNDVEAQNDHEKKKQQKDEKDKKEKEMHLNVTSLLVLGIVGIQEPDRVDQVLRVPCFRYLACDPRCVGDWICNKISTTTGPATSPESKQQVLKYFQILSKPELNEHLKECPNNPKNQQGEQSSATSHFQTESVPRQRRGSKILSGLIGGAIKPGKAGTTPTHCIACNKKELNKELSKLPRLLPVIMKQNDSLREGFAVTMPVIAVVEMQLLASASVLFLMLDGIFLIISFVIVTFLAERLRNTGQKATYEHDWEFALLVLTMLYRILRELGQASAMFNQKMLMSWAQNTSNIVEFSANFSMGVLFCLKQSYVQNHLREYRVIVAVTCMFLWGEALEYIRLLSMNFATFVLCLKNVFFDVISFLIILVIVLLMFGQMMYNIFPGKHELNTTYGTASLPSSVAPVEFKTFPSTMLTLYAMMLSGEFESVRTVFHSPELIFLFISFTFVVAVVMMNILIAIVSDSYKRAVTRSRTLFLRTRLEKATQLSLIRSVNSPDHKDQSCCIKLISNRLKTEHGQNSPDDDMENRMVDAEARFNFVANQLELTRAESQVIANQQELARAVEKLQRTELEQAQTMANQLKLLQKLQKSIEVLQQQGVSK